MAKGYQGTNPEQRAFDACWEVYKACREMCESGRLSALDASAFKKITYRPDVRARAEDFLADFAKAGQAALERRKRHSRLALFRVYYLGLAPYESARHFLGIGEISWVQWTEEIRETAGEELVKRGVYPPKEYFEK